MRTTILLATLLFVTFLASSCKKCNNENPTARILNNGISSVDMQITASDGSIVTIFELAKDGIHPSKEYASGSTTIQYTIEGVEQTDVFTLNTCTSYDITINSNNRSEERRVGKECRSRWSQYN